MQPWKIYERMIAQLFANQVSTGYVVTPNARIVGVFTGVARQIDVLIEERHDTNNDSRTVVEAKRRSRPVDVKDVETLLGMMDDVEARFGYLVCPTGNSPAALKRAQETVRICIVPLDRIADFDPLAWPECRSAGCANGRIFWDGFPMVELTVQPISTPNETPKNVGYPQKVGKCETCGAFHAECMVCGDIMTIPHENDENDFGKQCSCRLPWFWLASTEKDERGRPSAELHLVLGSSPITVNRRSR